MFNPKQEEPKMLDKIIQRDESNVVKTPDVVDLRFQAFWHELKAGFYLIMFELAIFSTLMSTAITQTVGWNKVKFTLIYLFSRIVSTIFPSFEFFGHSTRYWTVVLSKGAWFTLAKLVLISLFCLPVFFLSWRRYNKRKTEADEMNRKKHLRGKQVVEAAYVLEDMIAEGIPGTLPIGCTVEAYDDPTKPKEEKKLTALSFFDFQTFKDKENREKFFHWVKGTKPKRVLPKKLSRAYVNSMDSFLKYYYENSIKQPTSAETEGCLVVGSIGCGKGMMMYPLTYMAHHWERFGPPQEDGSPAKPAKIVVLDRKGDEYVCKYFNPETDILFNFCDVRGEAWHWNFLDEKEAVLVTDVAAIAESLIAPMEKVEPFWRNAPRDVFKGLMLWCIKNDKRTLYDLYHACCSDGTVIQKYLNETDGADGARVYLADPTSKMCQSVLSCLVQEVECLSLISKKSGKPFNIDDWLDSDQGGTIFLQYPKSLGAVLKGYYTVFLDTLARKILSKTSDLNRRMFMFLDEFATLNKCPAILEMLNQGRSKGCCIFIILQSLAQVKLVYSEEEMHALIAGCGSKLVFNLGDNFSAKYFEEFYGKQDAMKTGIGETVKVDDEQDAKQISFKDEERVVLKAGELTNIPRFHAYLMLRTKRGHDLTLVQFPVVSIPNKPDVPMLILRDDLYLKNRYNLKSVYESSKDFAKEKQLDEINQERGFKDISERTFDPENGEENGYSDVNEDFPDTVNDGDKHHSIDDEYGI